MSFQINSVILAGNITKDPEVKKTTSDKSYCFITIAQNQKKADGSNKAIFLPATVWGQAAEFLGKYAHKGDNVHVEGSLSPNTIEAGDKKLTTLSVNINKVQITNSKGTRTATAEEAKPEVAQEDPFGTVDLSSDDLPF